MQALFRTFESAFGCHHRNLSRVFTIDGRTYRVCCECGAQFDYSLEKMHLGRRLPPPPMFAWVHIA
jgi:hypothetical protein